MQKEFTITDTTLFINKALEWSQKFEQVAWLTDNDIKYPQDGFIKVLAAGARATISGTYKHDAFNALKEFHQDKWVFGYFGYDLKNSIEELESNNPDELHFPDFYFFKPETLIFFKENSLNIMAPEPDEIFSEIVSTEIKPYQSGAAIISVQHTSREKYITNVEKIRRYIEEGEVYELNYCINCSAQQAAINPLQLFNALNEKSPMPFASFLKINDNYLLCASPERFLKKTGNRLLSQPIKGTARRNPDPELDIKAANQLRESEKEQAENMMIVDLVRNDLARTAVTGSVKVDEMFGIYSFRFVHQMISSISSELRDDIHFTEAIKWAFPMGSMTGAPKIRAMQLIDELETFKRGLFSGAVGYFTPAGDFDLNVVIRSIFYNATTKSLSFNVGSAITYDSIPEDEWEECLLKAAAILEVLKKN